MAMNLNACWGIKTCGLFINWCHKSLFRIFDQDRNTKDLLVLFRVLCNKRLCHNGALVPVLDFSRCLILPAIVFSKSYPSFFLGNELHLVERCCLFKNDFIASTVGLSSVVSAFHVNTQLVLSEV